MWFAEIIYHYCSDTSAMKFGNCSTSLSHRKLEVNRWITGQNIIIYQRWDQSFKINNNNTNSITKIQQVNIYVWGNGLSGEWCGAFQALGSTLFPLKWVFLFLYTLPVLLEKVEKGPSSGMSVLCHTRRRTSKQLSHFTLVNQLYMIHKLEASPHSLIFIEQQLRRQCLFNIIPFH